MGYTPVFDTVFQGTLCGKWPALPVWLTVLPLADWRGHIDMTPEAIAANTGWPLDLLLQGIEELCKPDPRSRSKEAEGRRLVPIDPERDWGWIVVNIRLYRSKAKDANQVSTGRNAEKVARYKARHPRTPVDTPKTPGTPHSYSDINSNKEEEINPQRASAPWEPPPGLDLQSWDKWIAYRKTIGKPLKPVSWPGAAKELAALGDGQAAAVEFTIAQGYQGLVVPRNQKSREKPQWV